LQHHNCISRHDEAQKLRFEVVEQPDCLAAIFDAATGMPAEIHGYPLVGLRHADAARLAMLLNTDLLPARAEVRLLFGRA
jgi:hypothetical protein